MSRWSDTVSLIGITEGTDAEGFPSNIEVTRAGIFANKLPVHSNEFYQASQAGYKIEKVFQVRTIDYEGEESLNYENEVYRIVRTYDKGEYIELSCEKRGDNHG
jgi:head-tail adaptor